MRVLIILAVFFSFQAFANEKFITRIHSVTWSEREDEEHLVKFQNARIGFFYHSNKFQRIFPGELVEVEITKDHKLVSVQTLPDENQISINTPFVTEINYVPTEISGYVEAQKIMDRFRKGFLTTSEAHNRAHVWAFEEFKRSNLLSMKAFLFFSENYIRKFNHKWWFHVAPFVTYIKQDKKIEKILDPTYADRPLSINAWANRLMTKKSLCKVIKKYSQALLPTSTDDCYVLHENMYFWQPKDLEILEYDGISRVNFFNWEIDHSLEEAFGITGTH